MSFFETSVHPPGKATESRYLISSLQSPITKCRSGRSSDIPQLKAMIDRQTSYIFGTDDVDSMFEKSYVFIVAENSKGKVVAGMFLNNYPNLPAIPPWDWKSWIRNIYHLVDTKSSNTLFIHLAIYNVRYIRTFFELLIRKVFNKCFLVKYIIIIIPPQKKFVDFLCPNMSVIQPYGVTISRPQKLVLYLRHNFTTSYKVRKAVIEDNDDLIPLIDMHSRRLKALYGSYYIAEIISDTTSKRHTIVSEYQGMAVGVIVFNEDVNFEILDKCFQLECFYGLRNHSDLDDQSMIRSMSTEESNLLASYMLTRDDKDVRSEDDIISLFTPKNDADEEYSTDEDDDSRILLTLYDMNRTVQKLSFESLTQLYISPSESFVLATPSNKDSLKGVIEVEFSYNLLHFTDAQLQQWKTCPNQHYLAHCMSYAFNISTVLKALRGYNGKINAFTLEIMAAWPEHEKCLADLLQASFELFPDRDYCIMCAPSSTPFFQLLNKAFVRVSPLPMSTFPNELYVVHRNALNCPIKLEKATIRDRKKVRRLLNTVQTGRAVYGTFLKNLKSKTDSIQSYIVLCDKDIVGVINVKDLNNLEYILSRYQLSRMINLNQHKPGCRGRIKHFVLSPIFHRHSRFLLLELHRLTDYSMLLYYVFPEEKVESFSPSALSCALNELIPVMPAKVPELGNLDHTDRWKDPEIMKRIEWPYAVYLSTPMLCGKSRFEINTKIVVVGASEVGLSFLTELIFCQNPLLHTIFNNITLVSTHGIPHCKSNKWQDIMYPMTSDTTSGYHLSLLSFRTYVNIVKGVMSGIDRKNKTITIDSALLPYDMLFLTCGTQFQLPIRPDNKSMGTECPKNVFVLNTRKDIDLAMTRLDVIAKSDKYEGNFVVYGNCIEAYCCLEGLLEYGLNPMSIVFVIPTYDESRGTFRPFEEPNVEEAIQNQISSIGVNVYKNYKFSNWSFDKSNIRVTSITFETFTRTYEVPVKAAFMYQRKTISKQTFTAINEANLIFDGALVISPEFETNDPNIYAAGRITKYPRRYYADHMRHMYFNQSEIGYRMARNTLKKLLPNPPLIEEEECEDLEGKMLVPRYTKPIILFAKVPRRIQYLYVRKPGVCVPMVIVSLDDHFGQILTTGDCNRLSLQGYFLLHLNQYNSIETIVALNQNEDIEKSNLTLLWGKHERLLNNLVMRYNMGLINDLFKFFSQPWIRALFHDQYEVLEKDLTRLLKQPSVEPGMSVLGDIVQKIKDNNMEILTPSQQEEVIQKFLKSEYHNEMENMVLTFLNDNYSNLPMYGTSRSLSMIMGAYADSPLFTNL